MNTSDGLRPRPWRRLVAGAVALALVLGACGDDDAETGAGQEPAEGETTSTTDRGEPVTGDPIKVGLAAALTGGSAERNGNALELAEAWVEMTNENGGVADRPVELVVRDTEGDAAEAQSAVRDLVETENVVAVFLNDSQAEGSVADYLVEHSVPVIGSEGYNTEMWAAQPNFFSYWLDIPGTIQASPNAAATLGAEHFAAISCAEVAACAQAEDIYEPASEELGMDWEGLVTISASAPDYVAECLTLIERGVDFVILSVVSSVAVRVVQDCLQQGYTGTFGSTAGGFEPALFEEVEGAEIAGALHGFPWWIDAEPVAAYRTFVEEYAPDLDYRGPVTSNMYAGLELFRTALDGSTDVTRESVLAAYNALDAETLDGLLAQPADYEAGQPAPKGVCYWPYTFDTSSGEMDLMEPTGESGNGVSGELQSTCVSELQEG